MWNRLLISCLLLKLSSFVSGSPVKASDPSDAEVDSDEDARMARGIYSHGGSMFPVKPGYSYHPHDLYKEEEYELPYRVVPKVDCLKTHMLVTLTFTRPFFGIIYPNNQYGRCTYFAGKGEKMTQLTLNHGDCGVGAPQPYYGLPQEAVMMKQLMIQWEPDIVQEYDLLLTVRCDPPEDYKKVVVFDIFNVVGLKEGFKAAQHPGPQLYMEVQRGEGPRGKPLEGPVYLGETLTLVFTVHDDAFQFDTNVLSCWASDANPNIYEASPYPLPPKMHVIDRGCTQKPKIFANFLKDNTAYPGAFTSTQWCYFKAFRFPSSPRIIINCEVEVCYKTCHAPPACSGYNPHYRGRRSASNNDTEESNPREITTLSRHIEVLMPNETEAITLHIQSHVPTLSESSCVPPSVFHATIGFFVLMVVVLVAVSFVLYRKLPLGSK